MQILQSIRRSSPPFSNLSGLTLSELLQRKKLLPYRQPVSWPKSSTATTRRLQCFLLRNPLTQGKDIIFMHLSIHEMIATYCTTHHTTTGTIGLIRGASVVRSSWKSLMLSGRTMWSNTWLNMCQRSLRITTYSHPKKWKLPFHGTIFQHLLNLCHMIIYTAFKRTQIRLGSHEPGNKNYSE